MQASNSAVQTWTPRDRVLIVEDDLGTRQGLQIRLDASGYDVVTAQNGREAVYKACHEYPDMILLDLGLPNADGLDLIPEFRKAPSCAMTPIIILAARDPSEAKFKSLACGAQGYLQKPVANQNLLHEIARMLGRGA